MVMNYQSHLNQIHWDKSEKKPAENFTNDFERPEQTNKNEASIPISGAQAKLVDVFFFVGAL